MLFQIAGCEAASGDCGHSGSDRTCAMDVSGRVSDDPHMPSVDVGIQIVADTVGIDVRPFLSLQGPGIFNVGYPVVVIVCVHMIGDSVGVGIR